MARVWILGGGLIGCGWAAAFAGAGHIVTVVIPMRRPAAGSTPPGKRRSR